MDTFCQTPKNAEKNNSRLEKKSKKRKFENGSGSLNAESVELRHAGSKTVNTAQVDLTLEDASNGQPVSGKRKVDNPARLGHKGKKICSKFSHRKYNLRSNEDGVRVLRSNSHGKCNTSPGPSTTSTTPAVLSTERKRNRRKRKQIKGVPCDDYAKVRKKLRYLLRRMNYEQSLLDAYAAEGWKGQSLDKLRPEKELQRATSEILRLKLKIRDLFQHLDTLCAEGRFQESLFDSEGQIDSEDIFCAKCGSKDLPADNDIVLCDGVCNRGFHQMCLEPPLLKEQIPPEDEGWLCPGCDCKVECIESLNDIIGTDLSIDDSWEKVFPEAVIAAGDQQNGDLELPSDDSEDNDYDPDGPEPMEEKEGSSSSESSDFIYASDDSVPIGDKPHDLTKLSSDDSEDDDYDPDRLDLDEKVKEASCSNESDFTSDTDDLDDFGDDVEFAGPSEVNESSTPVPSQPVISSGKRNSKKTKRKSSVNLEEAHILEDAQSGRNASAGMRLHQQLDYKNLYDEYGDTSGSSDDEEWTEMNTPNKLQNNRVREASVVASEKNTAKTSTASQRRSKRKESGTNLVLREAEDTPVEGNRKEPQHGDLIPAGMSKDIPGPDNSGNKSTPSSSKFFGSAVYERLDELFRVNTNPSRETKESLSKEIGITIQQVSRWFERARRRLRISAKMEASKTEGKPPNNENNTKETNKDYVDPKGEKIGGKSNGNRNVEIELSKGSAIVMPENENNTKEANKDYVDPKGEKIGGNSNGNRNVEIELSKGSVIVLPENGQRSIHESGEVNEGNSRGYMLRKRKGTSNDVSHDRMSKDGKQMNGIETDSPRGQLAKSTRKIKSVS